MFAIPTFKFNSLANIPLKFYYSTCVLHIFKGDADEIFHSCQVYQAIIGRLFLSTVSWSSGHDFLLTCASSVPERFWVSPSETVFAQLYGAENYSFLFRGYNSSQPSITYSTYFGGV